MRTSTNFDSEKFTVINDLIKWTRELLAKNDTVAKSLWHVRNINSTFLKVWNRWRVHLISETVVNDYLSRVWSVWFNFWNDLNGNGNAPRNSKRKRFEEIIGSISCHEAVTIKVLSSWLFVRNHRLRSNEFGST